MSIKRIFRMMTAVALLVMMVVSCKKDPCKNVSCPQGTVATESADGKKCSCEPITVVENKETEIVKVGTIAEIQALEQKIRDLKSGNEHLKNVVIEFAKSIETADNQKVALQEFGKLKTKLKSLGLAITLDQGDAWFYPKDDKQYIYPSEYKLMIGDWEIGLNLGINLRFGYPWYTDFDSIPEFVRLGVQADAFKKQDPIIIDSVTYTVYSIQEAANRFQYIEDRYAKANTFTCLKLGNDIPTLNMLDQNLIGLFNLQNKYPDKSKFVLDLNGKAIVPSQYGVPITPTSWGYVNYAKIAANGGHTFASSCEHKGEFFNKGLKDTANNLVITWNYVPCTIFFRDTIDINAGRDFVGYSAHVAATLAKANSTQYVRIIGKGGNVGKGNNVTVTGTFPWAEFDAFLADVSGGKVILLPTSAQFVPYGKVSANGRVPTLVAANQMGLLKSRTIADTANCWTLLHTDPNKSQMPVFAFLDQMTVPGDDFAKFVAPIIRVTANYNISGLPQALYTSMPWKTTKFYMTPGAAFLGVDQNFLEKTSIKDAYDPNNPFATYDANGLNLVNVLFGNYISGTGTSTVNGFRGTIASAGPGTGETIKKMAASQALASNPNLQRANLSNVTLVITGVNKTSHPQIYDGNNLIMHYDSLAKIPPLFGIVGSLNIKLQESIGISAFVPSGTPAYWFLVGGGAEQDLWDMMKINQHTNSTFLDNATNWYGK